MPVFVNIYEISDRYAYICLPGPHCRASREILVK